MSSLQGENQLENGEPGTQTEEEEIATYRRDLAYYPTLSLKQERLLVNQLLATPNRKQEIMQRLIEGQLQQAFQIAQHYQGRGIALVELMGEANVALAQAAKVFIPAPNRTFHYYACKAIHWSLLRLFKEVPEQISLDSLLPPQQEEYERDPEDENVLPMTLLEQCANTPAFASPERDWAQIFDLQTALTSLQRLDELILKLRYRIGEPHQPYIRSLEEVGKLIGVTRERIRQREERALRLLKKSLVYGIPRGAAVGKARPPALPKRKWEKVGKKPLTAPAQKQPKPAPQQSRPKFATGKGVSNQAIWSTSTGSKPFSTNLSPSQTQSSKPLFPLRRPDLLGTEGMGKSWQTKKIIAEMLQNEEPRIRNMQPLQRARGDLGNHPWEISSLQWAPDATKIALVDGSGCLWMYETPDGSVANTIPALQKIASPLCWSPDGTYLASIMQNGNIGIWNVQSGEAHQVFTTKGPAPSALCWSADNHFFAAASHEILLWDTVAPRFSPVRLYKPLLWSLSRLAWSPTYSTLAAGLNPPWPTSWLFSDAHIVVLDANTGQQHKNMVLNGMLIDLIWSPDGQQIVTITENAESKRLITLWSVTDGAVLMQNEVQLAQRLHWPMQKNLLYIQSQDGWITILQMTTGELQERIHLTSKAIELSSWMPNNAQLALVLRNEPGIWIWSERIEIEPDLDFSA